MLGLSPLEDAGRGRAVFADRDDPDADDVDECFRFRSPPPLPLRPPPPRLLLVDIATKIPRSKSLVRVCGMPGPPSLLSASAAGSGVSVVMGTMYLHRAAWVVGRAGCMGVSHRV